MTDQRKAPGLVNDTTRLLRLDGVEVTSVRLDDGDRAMIALITRDEQARYCPMCGMRSEHPPGVVTSLLTPLRLRLVLLERGAGGAADLRCACA